MREMQIDQVPNLHIFGRAGKIRCPLNLFWTGSGIEMNVRAGELWIETIADYGLYEPWFCVLVDDVPVMRQMALRGQHWVPILRTAEGTEELHNVKIIREVQAMHGDPQSFLQLNAVRTDGEFCPLSAKAGRIEFIGDSITAGEGTVGTKGEMNWSSMVFSSVRTYAYQTAHMLHADFRILAQSGWGILSDWEGDPACSLPRYYTKVCGVLCGEENRQRGALTENDFASWQPNVVVINLGTNDRGAFDQPPKFRDASGVLFDQKLCADGSMDKACVRRLQHAVVDFLYQLRQCNPGACLMWAYGMLGADLADTLRQAIEAYRAKSGDSNVKFVLLPQATEETIGSRGHPGSENHRQAAEVLAPKIIPYLNK
ncbi:MAG: SGNH/GDSL hydrolase family protein [Oscillospiraceae bacterium]|jgi:hypothetical protein|nr:SGNH/GDSL hydrolase family protein [Oscillospiraceae bacterium]MDD3260749.1 SGNH/GDSL hydrolase family protein [Oscillospiraceae bacterium]